MRRYGLVAKALVGVGLLLAACESEYDPTADVSERARHCAADMEYRSCTRPGSCVEWGYPADRVAEIDAPGHMDCSTSGGVWASEPCAMDAFVSGCRNVWASSCATVWVSAAATNLGERQQACELHLGGVWIAAQPP